MKRVVIVGAGLAGLVTSAALAKAGLSVTCVHFGVGGIPLSPGVVDVYGYAPEWVAEPLDAVAAAAPGHPYAAIGAASTRRGLELLAELAGPDLLNGRALGYDGPLHNACLVTAIGAPRPTCLYPPSMAAGVAGGDQMVIVGFKRLKDFYPELIAGNCGERAVTVDVVARRGESDTPGMAFARFFDTEAGRRALVAAVRSAVDKWETVGLPAVIGLQDVTAWRKVEEALGQPVCEIPLAPPSVPGWRLQQALVRAAQQLGVRFIGGSKVMGVKQSGGRVSGVVVNSAGHNMTVAADAVVLATGGFESGGLVMDSRNAVSEPVMGLPLANVPKEPFVADAFAPQPLFLAGVRVDEAMRPLDLAGNVVCGGLHAVGGLLAGSIRWDELTGEGIAVGSAVAAADAIGEELA